MSGSTVVVEVAAPGLPAVVVEVTADKQAIDVIPPAPPTVTVTLPTPVVPSIIDVTALPPTVSVGVVSPAVPLVVDAQADLAITVHVVAPQPGPVVVDALAAWQTGVPDAPVDGKAYVRRNNAWIPDIVTSVARKTGDVLLYSHDLEDWDIQVIDGGNF